MKERKMNRRTFYKIVSYVGLGLALLLFTFAGLLNFGASFANESVKTQLENQNIAFPAEDSLPADTKEQLTKWAGKTVNTGEMARDYSDLYIWEHMKGSSIAVTGKPSTYSEVSGTYMGLVRGGSTDVATITKYADLRETLFMGNTLRGMLLQAYAFGTMGVIAGYAAIAAFGAGLLFLLLAIAGFVHLRRTPEEATI
jgi:amino acid permease